MIIEVIIGVGVGLLLGALQVLVLQKVVKAVTEDNEKGSKVVVLLTVLQFAAFIAVLVFLGLYSLYSVATAGLTMAITAVFVWVLISNKNR